jgi:predicted MFS family arabinose efflux permease
MAASSGVLRNRWWVVAASVLGLLVGTGSINVFAFGVLLKPISEDLHLGRGTISAAGGLTSIIYLYTLFPLVGLMSVGQTPAAYSKAVSAWFDKDRGLALGIALAGVGLGTAVLPPLTAYLIAHFGWRHTYWALGALIMALAFLPVAIFIREPEARETGAAMAQKVKAGLLLGEAVKTWRYWALTLAFFLGATAINGTLTHTVPLLTDRGVPIAVATGAISAAGITMIVGRVFSGYCLDKIFGPYVAIAFFLCPLAGMGLLYSGAAGLVPLMGTILLGLGIGAEFDLMAFFVTRYFGLRSYGVLYGLMFGVAQIGNAVGSNIMGWSYQVLHSYAPAFSFFAVALAITCVLFIPLGPYRFAPRSEGAPLSQRRAA